MWVSVPVFFKCFLIVPHIPWNVFIFCQNLVHRLNSIRIPNNYFLMIFVICNLTSYILVFCNFNLHIRHCKSYVNDLTTVPYIGDDSTVWRLFCTAAFSDNGPVRPQNM